jgi:signal transduction histidine kinase
MVALPSFKVFQGLPQRDLEALESITKIRNFQPLETIFQAGDLGDGLYLVAEGLVEINVRLTDKEQRALSKIGPGDFFGEMAVIDNGPRSAAAIAMEASTVYFIPRDGLEEILKVSPPLATGLMREFSIRMRDFNRSFIQEVLQAERLTMVGKFARTIVHDFKNPLNVIGIASDLAAMDGANLDSRKLARDRVHKQVDRLTNMINELLEFTRTTHTERVLNSSNYCDFVQSVYEDMKPEVEIKSIHLRLSGPPPDVNLLLDPKRLSHVFFNLIHNASDELKDDGVITLNFAEDENWVFTEVEDNGPGIPKEITSTLFEAFATHGKSKGTGLGLSICRRIIEDHDGRIEAFNRPGGGAVFRFKLPKIPATSRNY